MSRSLVGVSRIVVIYSILNLNCIYCINWLIFIRVNILLHNGIRTSKIKFTGNPGFCTSCCVFIGRYLNRIKEMKKTNPLQKLVIPAEPFIVLRLWAELCKWA